jgi:drug/metabolite transporter (DMT)-like permease
MTRLRADFLLLITAMIWGTAFVAQKIGNGAIGPFLFVAGRFFLSALLLAPLALREMRLGEHRLARRDWLLGLGIGVTLFAGSAIQQVALNTTSVTNAGFLTALYIAFVPFVAWAVVRTRIRPIVLAAVVVSLLGAWLLANHGAAPLTHGDFLVLGSAMLYALHIVLVSIFLKQTHRPFFLCLLQYSVTAALGAAIGFTIEPANLEELRGGLPTILYAGILSGGLGYTFQIVAQRYTPATEAALIMSMESMFAALAAAVLLGERLTLLATIGCGLVLLGVIMVEVGPALPRRGRAANANDEFPPIGAVPLD